MSLKLKDSLFKRNSSMCDIGYNYLEISSYLSPSECLFAQHLLGTNILNSLWRQKSDLVLCSYCQYIYPDVYACQTDDYDNWVHGK